MLQFNSSTIAASALYLAIKVAGMAEGGAKVSWDRELQDQVGYHSKDLRDTVNRMYILYQSQGGTSLCAIKNKFSLIRFSQVAKLAFSAPHSQEEDVKMVDESCSFSENVKE
mmetsp:Transcript_12086/g.8799  ORF Transcript_12086/g.8799 Transcript_12086/m.8799 type:complete len:112 (-) Transcript_12086:33-368(-)